jgi:hypothetical protein
MLKYRISYPAGWTLTKATKRWVFGGTGGEPASSMVDEFHSTGKPYFYVASQQLPTGMTLLQWIRAYEHDRGPPYLNTQCWAAPGKWTTTHVAGHLAKEHGGYYCDFTEVVTVVDGRAYVFRGSPNYQRCCTFFDQTLFQALMASVTFPSGASGTPSTSPT